MTRAGILIRVSTQRQGDQGVSTTTQEADCRAYAERMGWQVVMVETDMATGTNFDRAGFQKLAEAAQRGEIEKVIVWSLDRFGRDQLGARLALRGLAQAGAELYTVAGVVKDDLLFTIISRVAEYQSEQTSEKVARNMAQRAATGHWQAPAPFGYDIGPCPDNCGKRLVPNADALIVRDMAAMFDRGESYAEIHRWLRAEHGLVKDAEWPRRVLQNPAYAGDVYFGRRGDGTFVSKGKRGAGDVIVTPNAHPALIDREVFERILTHFKTCGFTRGEPRALDGIVWCGSCGSRCYPVPGGRKGAYKYTYICSARQRFSTCSEPRVAYQTVADALEAALESLPSLSHEIGDIRRRLLAAVAPDLKAMLRGASDVREQNEAERKRIERERDNLVSAVARGLLTDEEAASQMADIREALAGNAQERKTLKSHVEWDMDEAEIELKIQALAPMERELTAMLVERIVISAGAAQVVWTSYGQGLLNKSAEGQPLAGLVI